MKHPQPKPRVLMSSLCQTTILSLHHPDLIRDSMSGPMVSRRFAIPSGRLKSLLHIEDSMPTDAKCAAGGISGGGNNLEAPARDRADDFNTGYHLEVGEPGSDRYQTSGRLEGTTATSLHPIPTRGADNRKARRAAGPARAGFPDSEHIGTGGVSGYPARTYLERIWGVSYVSR